MLVEPLAVGAAIISGAVCGIFSASTNRWLARLGTALFAFCAVVTYTVNPMGAQSESSRLAQVGIIIAAAVIANIAICTVRRRRHKSPRDTDFSY